jgi:hypothetical protein
MTPPRHDRRPDAVFMVKVVHNVVEESGDIASRHR